MTRVAAIGGFAAALLLFVLLALSVPADHDETQYVAAAHLVAQGLLPYRDFPYLQTPLQPFLIAPLSLVAPGWLFLAARLANALAMALAALLLARTAARLSGRAIAAPLAMVAIVSIDAVQFGGSVARNDALPMLFLSGALALLFGSATLGWRGAAWAGLLLALAASAKISYALPAAAAAAQALWHGRRADRGEVTALLGGMLVGGLPILLFAALVPGPFLFGVVHYSVDAVAAWQELLGRPERLAWTVRLPRLAALLALGPALILLIGLALSLALPRRRPEPRPLGIALGPLLLAALLAAALPSPVYRQYLVPIVPPLVLLSALRGEALLAALRLHRGWAALAAILLAASLVAGFVRSAGSIVAPAHRRPLAIERQAHAIGEAGRRAGGGAIGGLDALLLVDSGLAFDARFATGPFLFRAGNLAACRDAALCPLTFASLDRLNRAPPRFLLTGSERRQPRSIPGGLDGYLDRWAKQRGYRAVSFAEGQLLWVAPQSPARSRVDERAQHPAHRL